MTIELLTLIAVWCFNTSPVIGNVELIKCKKEIIQCLSKFSNKAWNADTCLLQQLNGIKPESTK
jgi:hypothetical protein